jgi:hypothetical protein
MIANDFLGLFGDFACLADESEEQMKKLVVLGPGAAVRSAAC